MDYTACFVLGLGLGLALGEWPRIRGWFISRRLIRAHGEVPVPQSRILKPFSVRTKRKPRINDDQESLRREQDRLISR